MAPSQRLILGGVNARANNPALLITPKVKEERRKGERTSELGDGEGERGWAQGSRRTSDLSGVGLAWTEESLFVCAWRGC